MITRRDFSRLVVGGGLAGSMPVFGGCGNRREVSDSSGGSRAGSGMVIGMIAKSQSNPVFQAARTGAGHRAEELTKEMKVPISVDWRTPSDEDPQRQAEFIEQLVAAGVDAITIACSDASKVTRAIDDAMARNVTVMCFDSDAPKSRRIAYVGTDDVDAGRQIMRNVGELLGDRPGLVAILAGTQTATNLQKRVTGAREELARHKNLRLKDVYYHKETPQDAYREVESVQKADPEINGWAMIGGWPLMTERSMPWQPGEVVCVGMDALLPELGHVRAGDVQVLLGQRYYYFGTKCVDLLVDHVLRNKKPETKVEFAPLDRVTKENVDEYAKNWAKWT